MVCGVLLLLLLRREGNEWICVDVWIKVKKWKRIVEEGRREGENGKLEEGEGGVGVKGERGEDGEGVREKGMGSVKEGRI